MTNETETFDIIGNLSSYNCLVVIESILQHAGYSATLNMLCVSRRWHELITDLGLWRRLLERRYSRDQKFRDLCALNGWNKLVKTCRNVDTSTLAFIFFASTDLRGKMNSKSPDEVCQIKTYDFINTLLLHNNFIIMGNMKGTIKIWTMPAEPGGRIPTKPTCILEAHSKIVSALCAKGSILASASVGPEKSVKLWSLDTFERLHAVRYSDGAVRQVQPHSMALSDTSLCLWYMSKQAVIETHGELVMWRIPKIKAGETWDKMAIADTIPFFANRYREKPSFGDVTDEFSAVAYPSQIILYENYHGRRFLPLREIALPNGEWVYWMNLYRGMMLTVLRKGDESLHGLLDDVIEIRAIREDEVKYKLPWKWRVFSPLKSAFLTQFGLVCTNTSERAYLWHWEDLPGKQ